MSLFRKAKRRENVIADEIQLRTLKKWRAYKKAIAFLLQQKTELLPTQVKKYCLIFFCLLFGGSSIAVFVYSATAKAQTIVVTKISKSGYVIQAEKTYLPVDSAITKKEYNRVEQFKNYLFRLKDDSTMKNTFDSIIQGRPQLIDSIDLFEKMYLQQK